MEKDDLKRNKKKKKNKSAVEGNFNGKIITDERFSSVHCDPRFQKLPKKNSKVTIDSRFNQIFTDRNFSSSSASVDKRGKIKRKDSKNPLLHYYKKEERESENEESEIEEKKKKFDKEIQYSSDDIQNSEHLKKEESFSSSDLSESDDSSSTNSSDDDDAYSETEIESEKESIPLIEQETRRLAVVNMDWTRVKAVDLFVVLSSFLPKNGQILSVAIYPSEFGLQRMEYEAVHGPFGFIDGDKEEKEEEEESDSEIDELKLLAYEKSKLRYYYAVVECESNATADHLYRTCDGVEFERTSNVLDLRFISDSMEFKHPPRDIATEAPPRYEGLDFHTRALQHSKVHLSWDEDEPQRIKILKRKFNPEQLAEMELKEFLASEEDESSEDEFNDTTTHSLGTDHSSKRIDKREKYRALIQSGNDSDSNSDDQKDMEVTFNSGLEDISKRILEKKDKREETVWEAYLRKRKEKKKARKNSKCSSDDDDNDDFDEDLPEEPNDFFLDDSEDADTADKCNKLKRSSQGRVKKKLKEEKGMSELEKEREASRAELELLLAENEAEQGLKGYNLNSKKAKVKKGKKMVTEDKIPVVDYDDPRFSAMLNNPLFTLDPTDPQYKRSAAYIRKLTETRNKNKNGELLEEPVTKNKRSSKNEIQSDDSSLKEVQTDATLRKEKHELSALVRSVKRKAGSLRS